MNRVEHKGQFGCGLSIYGIDSDTFLDDGLLDFFLNADAFKAIALFAFRASTAILTTVCYFRPRDLQFVKNSTKTSPSSQQYFIVPRKCWLVVNGRFVAVGGYSTTHLERAEGLHRKELTFQNYLFSASVLVLCYFCLCVKCVLCD